MKNSEYQPIAMQSVSAAKTIENEYETPIDSNSHDDGNAGAECAESDNVYHHGAGYVGGWEDGTRH